jgi:hypothetical protein
MRHAQGERKGEAVLFRQHSPESACDSDVQTVTYRLVDATARLDLVNKIFRARSAAEIILPLT